MTETATEQDRVIWRSDLCAYFQNIKPATVRKWVRLGKLPPPDVDLSSRTKGWKQSTLTKVGFVGVMAQPEPPQTSYDCADRAFHLYRHFDAKGALLYVGVSINALNRLAAHRQSAPWFWSIAKVEVTSYPTRKASLDAERKAVKEERPLFNVQHAERA
jgi:hypothetical protein